MDQNPTLPGGLTLFKSGFSLYKQHLGTLLALALGTAALSVLIQAGGAYVHATRSVSASIALLALLPFWLWATLWIALAMLYVFEGSPQPVSAWTALRRAAPRVFPFLWVALLGTFVMLGAVGIGAGLPALLVLAVVLGTHAFALPIALGLAAAVGIVLLLVISIPLGISLAFTNWLFIDGARGLTALAASRALTKGVLKPIFVRIVVLTVFSGLVGAVVGLVVGIVVGAASLLLHLGLGASFARDAGNIISQLILTPVNLGAMFLLYGGLKAWKTGVAATAPVVPGAAAPLPAGVVAAAPMAEAEAPRTGRLLVLAILGFIAVPLLFAATVAFAVLGVLHSRLGSLGALTGVNSASSTAAFLGGSASGTPVSSAPSTSSGMNTAPSGPLRAVVDAHGMYRNASYGYAFQTPDGWMGQELASAVEFKSPDGASTLVVQILPSHGTGTAQEQLKARLPDCSTSTSTPCLILYQQAGTLDGAPSLNQVYEIVSTHQYLNEASALRDGKIYVIDQSASSQAVLTKYQKAFQDAVGSFSFL